MEKCLKNWKALQANLKAKTSDSVDTAIAKTPTKTEDLWFEVDEQVYKKSLTDGTSRSVKDLLPKRPSSKSVTTAAADSKRNKYVAMDCEYVGVGPEGKDSALARLTLVNWYGEVLVDVYVKPLQSVTDYRTAVSGIRPEHLRDAITFKEAQELLTRHLKNDQVLVGHGLDNDMRVLLFHHPHRMIRDTSKYRPFRRVSKGRTPSLKRLAEHFLGLQIQTKEHDSVEDAQTAMVLYQSVKDEWESWMVCKQGSSYGPGGANSIVDNNSSNNQGKKRKSFKKRVVNKV